MDETARADVIVGVDTHKHVHAAVAIDALLARRRSMPALGHWSHVVWAVLPDSAFGR